MIPTIAQADHLVDDPTLGSARVGEFCVAPHGLPCCSWGAGEVDHTVVVFRVEDPGHNATSDSSADLDCEGFRVPELTVTGVVHRPGTPENLSTTTALTAVTATTMLSVDDFTSHSRSSL